MNQASTFLLNDTTMLGPSAIPLSIQMGRDERLVGPGGVPFPDARERLWTGWFLQMGVRWTMNALPSAPIRSSAVSCKKRTILTQLIHSRMRKKPPVEFQ